MRESSALRASRARLAVVLRATKDAISIQDTAHTLGLSRTAAAKLLSRWRKQGWLRRIGRGLYVRVPIDLADSEQVVEDPWVLVPALFGQCYIGGWTAAHHWDLTDQLFNETVVFTTRRVSAKRVAAQGVTFVLHHIGEQRLFGLKSLWRGTSRVNISDPARTLIDMLAMPETGGGIDHVAECLATYANSASFDSSLLIRHAEQLGNGAVYKRLGFLAQALLHHEELAKACGARMTQGHAQLDPARPSRHLQTAWRLWVPERWRKVAP